MDNEIKGKFMEFIAEQTGVKIQEIKSDAELERDLGLYGDDAFDFIIAFSKRFNVDISNFRAKDYIGPEGDFILPTIVNFLLESKKLLEKI